MTQNTEIRNLNLSEVDVQELEGRLEMAAASAAAAAWLDNLKCITSNTETPSEDE